MTGDLLIRPRCSYCIEDPPAFADAPCARCALAIERLGEPGVSRVSIEGQVIR